MARVPPDATGEVAETVARARYARARALASAGRVEEALQAFDALISEDEPIPAKVLSDALVADPDRAEAVFGELVSRNEAIPPDVLAGALLAKGDLLRDEDAGVAAVSYVTVVFFFHEEPGLEMRTRVARALCQFGYCMRCVGLNDVAREAFVRVCDSVAPSEGGDIGGWREYARESLELLDDTTS